MGHTEPLIYKQDMHNITLKVACIHSFSMKSKLCMRADQTYQDQIRIPDQLYCTVNTSDVLYMYRHVYSSLIALAICVQHAFCHVMIQPCLKRHNNEYELNYARRLDASFYQ
jgi:hypothetical protein